jgi:hypothetical protein
MKMGLWKWVCHEGQRLCQVGILPDGTLRNPNGYPEDIVRAAVQKADAEQREARSNAAKKAAMTRARRQERKIYATAQRIIANEKTGPRNNCVICGKGLSDAESIERGIGSECWQDVLKQIERLKQPAMQSVA